MANEFDPIDLVILTAAIARTYPKIEWTTGKAERAIEWAEELQKAWLEIDSEKWGGVFAYDVVEPLGTILGEHLEKNKIWPARYWVCPHIQRLIEYVEKETT